jgi:hypothetical protein
MKKGRWRMPYGSRGGPPTKALTALVVLAGAVVPDPGSAQASPDTDIWVFPISREGAAVEVSAGYRATRRPGYDNQPSFLPGGRTLLFTSIDSTGQADIQRLDLQERGVEPFTRTSPESEYSPTPMPGGDRISVIRVEADSTQRLWSFDLAGGSPALVLPDVEPVGYHAWIGPDRLALFVLGSPATLQIATVGGGQGTVVARNIGRSLHLIPGSRTVSFVQLEEGGAGRIQVLDPASGKIEDLAPVLEGNEFHAWTPSGALLSAQGSRIFRWAEGDSPRWEPVADLAPAGVRGITRMAVSPEGDRIAVVGVGG